MSGLHELLTIALLQQDAALFRGGDGHKPLGADRAGGDVAQT